MDETRARAYLATAPADALAAMRWFQDFLPDPGDTLAEAVTLNLGPATDCVSAQVARWTRSEAVKARWPVDDKGGRQVITRHLALGDAAGLVPPRAVLTQRCVLYSDGRYARFDN